MNKNVLIIGFVWPEPKSSAAGNRMMQLIDIFCKENFKITFASSASDSAFMDMLEFPRLSRKEITLNSSDFDLFISALNPDIVIFDRFMSEEQFGWRVAQCVPNALRILDTEDLRCLRMARERAVKESKTFERDDLLSDDTAKREIACILRCDVSLIISEFEMDVLTSTFRIDQSLLFYLPLFAESPNDLPPFESRQDFVFIGNFLHEPNKDTVRYLKEKIWPTIHDRLPTVALNIYGAYPPPSVLQWNSPKTNFLIKGRAEDAKEVIGKARVMLAPLRFGAGIKGKLLESMAYGTPSVTTTIGAEAMPGDLPWNGTVENSPVEFANAALALYHDKSAWMEAQENGRNIIRQRFLSSNFTSRFLSCINTLQLNLAVHRKRNFIGAMLMHHTMKSTEYMSRWIEAKNK